MASAIRPHLISWLVALHGALALCGPGIHALPGFELHPASEVASDETGQGSERSGSGLSASNHCTACEYFAQAQIAAVAASVVSSPSVVREAMPIPPPVQFTTPSRWLHPRAPPISAASPA